MRNCVAIDGITKIKKEKPEKLFLREIYFYYEMEIFQQFCRFFMDLNIERLSDEKKIQ